MCVVEIPDVAKIPPQKRRWRLQGTTGCLIRWCLDKAAAYVWDILLQVYWHLPQVFTSGMSAFRIRFVDISLQVCWHFLQVCWHFASGMSAFLHQVCRHFTSGMLAFRIRFADISHQVCQQFASSMSTLRIRFVDILHQVCWVLLQVCQISL